MKAHIVLLSLIVAPALADSGACAATPPSDWIDPATGHRVIRLSGDGGGSSLYFHQNAYTPKGDRFVFNTKAGIAAIDLTRLGKEPARAEVVVPGARAIATAWRTPDVYYVKSGALHATNLETKVGLFVMVGLVLIGALMIFFGRVGEKWSKTYTVTIDFPSAGRATVGVFTATGHQVRKELATNDSADTGCCVARSRSGSFGFCTSRSWHAIAPRSTAAPTQ